MSKSRRISSLLDSSSRNLPSEERVRLSGCIWLITAVGRIAQPIYLHKYPGAYLVTFSESGLLQTSRNRSGRTGPSHWMLCHTRGTSLVSCICPKKKKKKKEYVVKSFYKMPRADGLVSCDDLHRFRALRSPQPPIWRFYLRRPSLSYSPARRAAEAPGTQNVGKAWSYRLVFMRRKTNLVVGKDLTTKE